MGLLNFWDLIENADFNEDRAVEVIRKCSTTTTFKQLMPFMMRSIYLAERHRGDQFDISARFSPTTSTFTLGAESGYIVDVCLYVKRRYMGKFGTNPHLHETHFQILVTPNGQVVGGRPTTAPS